jgi:hypothetical protein
VEKEAKKLAKALPFGHRVAVLVSPKGAVVGVWAPATGQSAPLRVRKSMTSMIAPELESIRRLDEGGSLEDLASPPVPGRAPAGRASAGRGAPGGPSRQRRTSRVPRPRRSSKRAD